MPLAPDDVNSSEDLERSKSTDRLSSSFKMRIKKNSCPPNICNGKLEMTLG